MSQDQGHIYEAQTSMGRLSNMWKVEGVSGLPVRSQNCESQAPVGAVLTVEGKWEDRIHLQAFVMCYHVRND